MYCVRFLHPLRGKFGNFYRTADFADVTDTLWAASAAADALQLPSDFAGAEIAP